MKRKKKDKEMYKERKEEKKKQTVRQERNNVKKKTRGQLNIEKKTPFLDLKKKGNIVIETVNVHTNLALLHRRETRKIIKRKRYFIIELI